MVTSSETRPVTTGQVRVAGRIGRATSTQPCWTSPTSLLAPRQHAALGENADPDGREPFQIRVRAFHV